jgi:predicted HicB family RNase H-like nuclease
MTNKLVRYSKHLVVRLTPELHQKLSDEAKSEGLLVSELVRDILKRAAMKRVSNAASE